MTITYGIIGSALAPTAATETEWIVCPAGAEYVGVVRITNTDSIPIIYRLAHTPSSGAAAPEDWDVYGDTLEVGEVVDITEEMGSGETLRVYASTASVSFKYSGMVVT